jgi:hypothetical protein
MESGPDVAESLPRLASSSKQGNLLNLTRSAITAGVAALSLAASATPALAKGGDEARINNTVVTFISPTAPAPAGDSSGSGSKGGGRPATCRAVGVDPVTGSILMTCTQARA